MALYAANPRQRAPDQLRFASFEDGGGQRHYYVEIAATDTAANPQADEIVLNNAKTDDALLKQMQSTATLPLYEALLKQAKEKGVVLESKKVWSKAREVELHLDRAANTIVIFDKIALVKQVRIYVYDDVVDMEKEIVVKIQDRVVVRRKVERSTKFLIDEVLKTGRRDMTYWGILEARL